MKLNPIAALALCLGIGTGAQAATILVTSDLGEVATVGGGVSQIMNAPGTWSDIAVDASGRMFATDGGTLYRIADGTARRLGNHAYLNGLAFDSKGRLYGAGDGKLYRVNKNNGASRLVGAVGGGFSSSGDIAFDDKDRLYAVSSGGCASITDCLFRLNPSTGKGSLIGSLGQRFVYGLAFAGEGLIGITDDTRLLSIDALTGASRVTGRVAMEGFATGLAAYSPISVAPPSVPPTPVPLPAGGGMLLAALGILSVLRRRP